MYVDYLFQQYKSLIGEDGWCIHYDKSLRKCSIYAGECIFVFNIHIAMLTAKLGLDIIVYLYFTHKFESNRICY